MYNLHQLGWYNFQLLANTVAREVFGQTSESFLPSKDGGKDGAFSGTWNRARNESIQGTFVFQCKFTSKLDYNLRVSDLRDEIEKVKLLVRSGECDNYIVFTNAGVSGATDAKIKTELKNAGVKQVMIYDRGWICQTIHENKRLRMLVPRVYGLGDLSQILDERVYAQGKELLNSLREDLGKVVLTSSYRRAAKALEKHSFVLLIGAPAAGKTTIASLLALTAMDQWETPTMKLETPDALIDHWNTSEKEQFVWIDDAFGVTQHETLLTQRWNHAMPQIRTMLQRGVKLVITSRDYIYEEARKSLKTNALPLLNESQIVIDVHNLTVEEKRQILYNHLKMGDQSVAFKREIKPYLEGIVTLEEFLPETARRLGSRFFTKDLITHKRYVIQFVKDQRAFFVDLLENLNNNYIAALALIYMNEGSLASPLRLSKKEEEAIRRLDATTGGCISALEAMSGNMVQLTTINDELFWKYKHPTIGDAFSEYIAGRQELIEIYLYGCKIEKLLNQASCGDVDVKNTIVIPKEFFSLILKRLADFSSSGDYKDERFKAWGARRAILAFLGTRCSDQFLKLYAEANPEIFEIVSSPPTYIEVSSEADLACRYHKAGLLPEEFRLRFVNTVTQYAKEGVNLYVLNLQRIRSLFSKKELHSLEKYVKNELIPQLSEIRERRADEFSESDEANYHMSPYFEVLVCIEQKWSSNWDIIEIVDAEKDRIEKWIHEHSSQDEMPERERLFNNSEISQVESERSIFDDVDE